MSNQILLTQLYVPEKNVVCSTFHLVYLYILSKYKHDKLLCDTYLLITILKCQKPTVVLNL